MPMVPQHPKLARVQKPQAPIFQAKPHLAAFETKAKAPSADTPPPTPEPEPLPLVTPLAVFAVSRKSFDCIVRRENAGDVMIARQTIATELPLAANGWKFHQAHFKRVGTRDGWPVWRVWRD